MRADVPWRGEDLATIREKMGTDAPKHSDPKCYDKLWKK